MTLIVIAAPFSLFRFTCSFIHWSIEVSRCARHLPSSGV